MNEKSVKKIEPSLLARLAAENDSIDDDGFNQVRFGKSAFQTDKEANTTEIKNEKRLKNEIAEEGTIGGRIP